MHTCAFSVSHNIHTCPAYGTEVRPPFICSIVRGGGVGGVGVHRRGECTGGRATEALKCPVRTAMRGCGFEYPECYSMKTTEEMAVT
jgi:hypothetical protein